MENLIKHPKRIFLGSESDFYSVTHNISFNNQQITFDLENIKNNELYKLENWDEIIKTIRHLSFEEILIPRIKSTNGHTCFYLSPFDYIIIISFGEKQPGLFEIWLEGIIQRTEINSCL